MHTQALGQDAALVKYVVVQLQYALIFKTDKAFFL